MGASVGFGSRSHQILGVAKVLALGPILVCVFFALNRVFPEHFRKVFGKMLVRILTKF
jgi:hypothetical protein